VLVYLNIPGFQHFELLFGFIKICVLLFD